MGNKETNNQLKQNLILELILIWFISFIVGIVVYVFGIRLFEYFGIVDKTIVNILLITGSFIVFTTALMQSCSVVGKLKALK